jgi:hypothetical protein
VMSESTMRYDPENDIFFHKHEDGSWSAYFCERHESLEEDEVRPYRGSFEPVGVAHPMTSHIQPLAAEARPVRSRGHRVKHDSRMLDRPPRRVGAVNVPILAAQLFALIPQPPGNAHAGRADLPRNPGRHLLGRKQRIEIRAPRACLP